MSGFNKKNVFFMCIMMVFTYAMIEGISFLAYRITEGEFFSFARIEAAKDAASNHDMGHDPVNLDVQALVLQPYWGYVNVPKTGQSEESNWIQSLIDRYDIQILIDLRNGIPVRDEGRVNIVVFGGSVAFWTAVWGGEAFLAQLNQVAQFQDKKIAIYLTAQGAMKQPQQVTKLAYLLALGAEFDIVVNLDGLNEAYHSVKNNEEGIFPFYPAYWSELTEGLSNSASLEMAAEILLENKRRASWVDLVFNSPLRFSITASTMWLKYDQYLSSQIAKLRQRKDGIKPVGSYMAMGPEYPLSGQATLYEEIANTWMRSSLGMRALAVESGARYFHFLQPNQYMPDSKPFSKEELELAYDDQDLMAKAVPAVYPLLIKRGAELQAAGVEFYDLTMMFQTEEQPRYIDTCCHLNEAGSSELAGEMGRLLVEQLQ